MLLKNRSHSFKANLDTQSKIRYETFEGVEHMVVPVIAAKEMVMNGFFYPAEEFSGWEETWNGVPLPISHPMANGMFVSAKSPHIQESLSIGWFFNVEFTPDKKLKGEMWINTEKAERLNASYVLDKFKSGELMEVSTGLFSNVEMETGTYFGEPYQGIIRHIRPDHLALLPNEVGACSLEDGCGAMRSNCEANKPCQCGGVCQTSDAQNNDSYVNQSDPVVLGADAKKDVQKTSSNVQVGSNSNENGGNTDMKEAVVAAVIANSSNGFSEDDREYLSTLSETVLAKMTTNEEEQTEEAPAEATEETTTEEVEQVVEAETEPVVEGTATVEESTEQKVNSVLDGIQDSEVKDLMGNLLKEHNEKKKTLVNTVVTNSELTKEDLEGMSFEKIEKLANSFVAPSYAGRGTSTISANAQASYTPPSIFDKE